MGNLAPEGTKVIRLTKDVDMTTEAGYRLAREAIRLASPNVVLWARIPTTGAMPNKGKHLNDHRDEVNSKRYHQLIAIFEVLARECHRLGWRIAIEWPRECNH